MVEPKGGENKDDSKGGSSKTIMKTYFYCEYSLDEKPTDENNPCKD